MRKFTLYYSVDLKEFSSNQEGKDLADARRKFRKRVKEEKGKDVADKLIFLSKYSVVSVSVQ